MSPFRLILHILVLLGLLTGWTGAATAGHLAASLDAETLAPKPGSRITIALVMQPEKDWHGYWENPGDAGIPTSVKWTLPAGVAVGPLRYPVPQRLIVLGLMNYVFERPYAHLMTLDIPANIKPGSPIRISGDANWLVCSPSICVPERGTVAIDLMAGDGAITPQARARFDGWRAKLPLPLSQPARFERKGDQIRLAIPFPADRAVANPYFYPTTDGAIDYAAPQAVSRNGDDLVIEARAAPGSAGPASLSGVLAIGPDRGLSLTAQPGAVPAAGAAIVAEEAGAAAPGGQWSIFLLALGGAIVGGLLLNVMPCVFPILSLKALSLARSGETSADARHEALAYAGGVILSCVALGVALLALRAGGATIGWAFQLQDPRVIFLLLLLVVAISLNLAGLFELATIGLGEGLTKGQGLVPAFWTGVLAAFVATPCTGPFMAGALGVALILPTAAAIAIFAGLGLGLALPFLLLGFIPALRRRLPKPGAWMNRLRHILSVPMFATALGLAWILGRQSGVEGMTLGLGGALLLGLGLWWVGGRQAGGRRLAWAPVLPVLILLAATVALIPQKSAPAMAATPGGAEPFSEARLAVLAAQKKPVFVYFTADWCLTCKVNEKAAIERDEVRQAFVKAGVVEMVGDWTDGDPAIGRFLDAQKRSGVPLYLFYHRDGRVETLPQLLTPTLLVERAQQG